MSQAKDALSNPELRKKYLRWLGAFGGVVVALFAIHFAYDVWKFETTDDAEVTAHTSTLSTKVGGLVVEVPVEPNQNVKAGDILMKIESADYQNRVDQIQAELESLQARLGDAGRVAARSRRLLRSDSVSVEQADSASAGALELNRKAASLAAQLAQAKLDLERTSVRAPTDGRVGKRLVEKGVVVAPGQGIMAFVEAGNRWVDANFKETQVRRIRVGQPVEIEIDAIEGHTFRGKVASFAPGTGATFAVLPPDNATGNFVKIVQRVQVRIAFDEPLNDFMDRLVPGLSTNVSVQVR